MFRGNRKLDSCFQKVMEWLNYHHLFYFWRVVRLGGVSRACEELRLAPSTVSAQLHHLEEQMGEKLLVRAGRRVVPTEVGGMVYRYAEEIFGLGRELMDSVKKRPSGKPLRLTIGVDDVLPKEIAQRLIEPAFHLGEPVQIVCRESALERLVADLAAHELDVVLSDAPATPVLNVRAFNHPLGESGVTWLATPKLAKQYRSNFPKCLDGAPILLPTDDTAIRRRIDQWFQDLGIQPVLVGEFEDYALLRVFGQRGTGLFPALTVLEKQFRKQYGVERVGAAKTVTARFFAVTVERRVNHPAVHAICESAKRHLRL